MTKTTVHIDSAISKSIGKLAKKNGMSKEEWMTWAVTMVYNKLLQKEVDRNKEQFIEMMAPLEETGQQPIPSYDTHIKESEIKTGKTFTFFMNDGGELRQAATNLQEAMEILQIGDNEYMAYIES